MWEGNFYQVYESLGGPLRFHANSHHLPANSDLEESRDLASEKAVMVVIIHYVGNLNSLQVQ